MSTSANDPNWFWDGQRWLWWNGHAWEIPPAPVPEPEPVAVAPPPPPAATTPPPPPAQQPPPPDPAAPAPGYPTATGYPTPGYSSGYPPGGKKSGIGKGWLATIIVVCAVLLLAVIGGGAYFLTHRGQDTPSGQVVTVQTEPLSTATDPFTPPAAPPGKASTDTPVTPVETPSAVRVKGGKAGLYGGTLDSTQCDKNKLIDFLEGNPDKARAWAGVQGIDPSAIRSFVSKLTSVILRSDTSVTNHGYTNGQATTFQSVLQAGTAVLVNDHGLPVVKCYCGNPLTAVPVDPGPVVYRGPTWSGWKPGNVTVIEVNTTVITNITVINIVNNQPFNRPTGSDGGQDTPTTLPSTSPTPTETSSPEPTMSGDYTGQQAYEILLVAIDKCVKRYGGSSFNELRTHPDKYTVTETPTGQGAGLFTVTIVEHQPKGTYSFTVNVPARSIVPANEAAAAIVSYCPELNTG